MTTILHPSRWITPLGAAAVAFIASGCGQSPPQAAAPVYPLDAPTAAAPYSPVLAKPGQPGAKAERPDSARPFGAPAHADLGRERVSTEARRIADWIVDSADNQGLPFIIVDKINAKVLAFGGDGRLRGASPALLGLAHGDDSVPGIGERKIADIRPEERTTPAGRFVAEMGVNANGEDILWVDYDAAVSMHRVRTANRAERRLQRLATATAADNRISYGCINLPVAFYEQVVKPLFAARNGIVYVLPETRPARAFFGAYEVLRTSRR
ncbi:MAG: hypothetical protein M3Y67_08335 [Pseudomonadota bacterium]|nr:hypothetical protein [Pseudomonadota bacterium]